MTPSECCAFSFRPSGGPQYSVSEKYMGDTDTFATSILDGVLRMMVVEGRWVQEKGCVLNTVKHRD